VAFSIGDKRFLLGDEVPPGRDRRWMFAGSAEAPVPFTYSRQG